MKGYHPTFAEQCFDVYLGLPEENTAEGVADAVLSVLAVLLKR